MNTNTWLSRSPVELAEATQRIRTAVSAVTVTVRSPEGDVTATAGAGGAITDLWLSGRALRRATAELSDALIEVIERAERQARAEISARAAEITGRQLPAAALGGPLPTAPPTDDVEHEAGAGADGLDEADALSRRFRQQLTGYASLRESLLEKSVTGASADGTIIVHLRGDGQIELIDIDPRALRSGAEQVGVAVLAAVRQARAAAAQLMAERVHSLVGDALDVRRMVADALSDPGEAQPPARPGRR